MPEEASVPQGSGTRIKLGIQPSEGGSLFGDALTEVALAEQLGFDSVWLSEHHGVRNHYWPSPMVALAALATRTERILLGTNILILPFYHPLRVAEEACMLQILSRGRFILGVGMGYREEEYSAFGIDTAVKGRRYEEGLAILKALIERGSIDFKGSHYVVDHARLEPKASVPIWAGGWGKENLRRAAMYARAWIPGPTADLPKLLECRALYHEFVRGLGEDPADREAPLTRELVIAPTISEAIEAAQSYLLPIYRDEYGGGWGHRLVPPAAAKDLTAVGRRRFIIGTPDQVIEEIKFYSEQMGCTHMIFRLYGPHTPHGFIMREIELLGREVLPAFRERTP